MKRPHRHEAQRGHRPERDLLAPLGRRDVRRVGLDRRSGRRGRGGATGGRSARRGGRRGRGRLAVVAGVAAGVAAASAAGASESPPCPMADRRSRDRLRRCSGISVTGRMIDGNAVSSGISRGDNADHSRCTYAQPGALGRVSCQTSYIRCRGLQSWYRSASTSRRQTNDTRTHTNTRDTESR